MEQHHCPLTKLPPELREEVYRYLVKPRQNPKAFHPGDSLPRKSTREGSYENWYWCGGDLYGKSDLFLSSTSNFSDAVSVMRTCRLLHNEVSHYIYTRLVWHAKLSVFHVPSLPLQFCGPRYSSLVNHFRILLRSEIALCLPLQALFISETVPEPSETTRRRVENSSLYRNANTFCQQLAGSQQHSIQAKDGDEFPLHTEAVESAAAATGPSRGLILHVEAQMVQEPDLIHSMQVFRPLKGFVKELHVGALHFTDGPPNKPELNKVVSNAAYLKLREMFESDVEWAFPDPKAQYKD